MGARIGIAIVFGLLASVIWAAADDVRAPVSRAGTRSAMVQAPRVPGATIAGPSKPDFVPEPLRGEAPRHPGGLDSHMRARTRTGDLP